MISNKNNLLLYCEPQSTKLEPTINDSLTLKMEELFKSSKPSRVEFKGVHTNPDGFSSTNSDFILPTGHITHSLCIHYLKHHRSEIPKEQIQQIESLPTLKEFNERIPAPEDLYTKPFKFFGIDFIDKETLSCMYKNVKYELYKEKHILHRASRINASLEWKKQASKVIKNNPSSLFLKDAIKQILLQNPTLPIN